MHLNTKYQCFWSSKNCCQTLQKMLCNRSSGHCIPALLWVLLCNFTSLLHVHQKSAIEAAQTSCQHFCLCCCVTLLHYYRHISVYSTNIKPKNQPEEVWLHRRICLKQATLIQCKSTSINSSIQKTHTCTHPQCVASDLIEKKSLQYQCQKHVSKEARNHL